MKYQAESGSAVISSMRGTQMTVSMGEKASKTLSSLIYSKHRIREAVIREIVTNALDTHRVVGKEDVSVKVILPTEEDQRFQVEDSGSGLTHDEIIKYLGSYFGSGSQHEEKPTGYHGLGSKSPHAYTDSYQVTSVKDGRKTMMLFYRGEDGVPAYQALVKDQPTGEGNGTKFIIPLNHEKDIIGFQIDAVKLIYFMGAKVDILNLQEDFDEQERIEDKMFDVGNGIKVAYFEAKKSHKRGFWDSVSRHESLSRISIVSGGILYPLPVTRLKSAGLIKSGTTISNIFDNVPSADSVIVSMDLSRYPITVEPGREGIETSSKNISFIESALEKLGIFLDQNLAQVIGDYNSIWEKEMKSIATKYSDQKEDKPNSNYWNLYCLYIDVGQISARYIHDALAAHGVSVSLLTMQEAGVKSQRIGGASRIAKIYAGEIDAVVLLNTDMKVKDAIGAVYLDSDPLYNEGGPKSVLVIKGKGRNWLDKESSAFDAVKRIFGDEYITYSSQIEENADMVNEKLINRRCGYKKIVYLHQINGNGYRTCVTEKALLNRVDREYVYLVPEYVGLSIGNGCMNELGPEVVLAYHSDRFKKISGSRFKKGMSELIDKYYEDFYRAESQIKSRQVLMYGLTEYIKGKIKEYAVVSSFSEEKVIKHTFNFIEMACELRNKELCKEYPLYSAKNLDPENSSMGMKVAVLKYANRELGAGLMPIDAELAAIKCVIDKAFELSKRQHPIFELESFDHKISAIKKIHGEVDRKDIINSAFGDIEYAA